MVKLNASFTKSILEELLKTTPTKTLTDFINYNKIVLEFETTYTKTKKS
jgi:hypothetical protein